jgi:hypothetical protein
MPVVSVGCTPPSPAYASGRAHSVAEEPG